MTEDTDCVNICLKIILPKNKKISKSGNRGWHHAAYSKKKVFRWTDWIVWNTRYKSYHGDQTKRQIRIAARVCYILAINSIYAKGIYDIYITGSNAFLLSSDLATLFTGRTMEIKVYPFSFMEYLTYYEITDGYDDAFDQYVRTGGMPGAYVYKTEDRQYDYVRDVYSTILVRDLVEKYKIRNKSEFTNISEFMMDNIGNLLSPNNISKTLNNDRSEITRKTVSKYIGYLENAFLFYEANGMI